MKTYRLVRESAVQTILSPTDAERMLGTGDYVTASAKPKARGRNAKRMRSLRQQRRAAGWLVLDFWLAPDQAVAVRAALLPNETYAEMLIRLVRKQSVL
ncbi:hypothetical protein D9M71_594240 [compost metagenome]